MNWAIAPCCWGIYWPEGNRLTWDQYLGYISQAGYRSTELGPYGFAPVEGGRLVDSLTRYKVALVAASHVHTLADICRWPILERRIHDICSLLQQAGARQFILMDEAEFYTADLPVCVTHEQWRGVLQQLARSADIVAQYQLEFAVHPHIGTCIQTESDIARLIEDCASDGVKLCLDTGHLAFWHADPVAFLEAHWSRVASIHLKNIDDALLSQVHGKRISCNDAFQAGLFTDLDRGAIDIQSLVQCALERGFAGPIIVEQDLSTVAERSPEIIARHNLEFLHGLEQQGTAP